MIDPGFWADQRVLVTGHTGFKGSWLTLWLRQLGAEVVGLAKAPATDPALFVAADLEQAVTSLEGDIVDAAAVADAIATARPTVIFHLAAQAIVRVSHQDPVGTFATNVLGTATVLDRARSAPDLRALVSVTSDKCYENNEWVWGYREDEPMGGHDPYSASKGCAELVTSAMRRSYFDGDGRAGIGSARAGNVVGGGDWAADRLIPDIIRAWSAGEEVVIRRPAAVRPWQHVLEPLAGYLLLAERLASGDDGRIGLGGGDGPAGGGTDSDDGTDGDGDGGRDFASGWNFGPGDDDTRPVQWVVERMAQAWGGGARWRVEEEGPHEAQTLRLDSSKARQGLGWRPRLDLATAVDWIVEWYRGFYQGEPARKLTDEQIARYQELLGP